MEPMKEIIEAIKASEGCTHCASTIEFMGYDK
jgi:hypothetical protein